MPFDEIQQAVHDGKVEAGLLIHEGQLTYEDEGLRKIVDLGEWWAEKTGGLPLPLGGNVIRRDLGMENVAKISRMLHDSIAYALNNREKALDYALTYGRGLDRKKADRFVGMYVNELTLDYGDRGRRAVQRLMDESYEKRLIPSKVVVEWAPLAESASLREYAALLLSEPPGRAEEYRLRESRRSDRVEPRGCRPIPLST